MHHCQKSRPAATRSARQLAVARFKRFNSARPRFAGESGACRRLAITTWLYNQRGEEMAVSDRLDAIFAALSDPTRRALLSRLALGEATVAELAEPFSMSQPAISKHLKVLDSRRTDQPTAGRIAPAGAHRSAAACRHQRLAGRIPLVVGRQIPRARCIARPDAPGRRRGAVFRRRNERAERGGTQEEAVAERPKRRTPGFCHLTVFCWMKSSMLDLRPCLASSERMPLSISVRNARNLSTCESNVRPICS